MSKDAETGGVSPEEQLEEVDQPPKVATINSRACGGGADDYCGSFEVVGRGKCEATIMVAGKPRAGKSTALNNIFDLNLVAKASEKSVTKTITINEVKKRIVSENNGEKK